MGTLLLVLVLLFPVGPMRRNVEKSVGDMLKSGDEIPEDAFSQYLWKNRETYTDAIMVQIALMVWVLVTAIRKRSVGVAVVTLGSFLFMKPVLVLVSLTMSVCWILTFLAVEYMLLLLIRK